MLLVAGLAGCIQAPDEVSDQFQPAATAPPTRIEGMTAEATHVDATVPCEGQGSIQIPPKGACAERQLEVVGRIGVDALPVDLSGPNGGVTIVPSVGDAWRMHATVRVRALTEDEARKGLDTAWAWTHEGPDGHALIAGPTSPLPLDLLGASVEHTAYEIELPSWVVLDLTADLTNGAVIVTGFDMGTVDVETTNGEIALAGGARDVHVATTNGAIHALLAPLASGSFDFETTNGQVVLEVPEGRTRGYDVDVATTNGQIEILLRDGTLDRSRDPGSSSAKFRSHAFDTRDIQTQVTIETTNGQVLVAPG